jgi:hypothetical protein
MFKPAIEDLQPLQLGELSWRGAEAVVSLQRMQASVDAHARRAMNWYLTRRRSRKVASRALRFLALVFGMAGGIVPLLDDSLPERLHNLGYLLIAIGGALLLANRALGVSTSWIRYMQTALRLQTTINAFQLRWAELQYEMSESSTPEQIRAALQVIRQFAHKVDELVLSETERWSAEFTDDLEQLESISQKPSRKPAPSP